MKRLPTAFCMAFGMFTRIPVPHIWDDEARPLVTLLLPVVGIVVGALWFALALVTGLLQLPNTVTAVLLVIFPYLLTGFMHLDGFMDCSDAILSRRDLAERQRILKDSHVGSFAVIALGILFLIGFALFIALKKDAPLTALIFIPAASRAVAGLGVSLLKPLGHSQYGEKYHSGVKKSHIALLALELLAALAAAFAVGGCRTFFPALAAAVFCCAAMFAAKSQLGGMSGDVSGYSITIGEVCAVAVLIFM